MKILETLPEIINVRSTWRTSSKNRLKYENSGKTFIKVHVDGEECSELYYFLHKTGPLNCTKKEVSNNMMSCTSDHHPVKIILSMDISEKSDRAQKWYGPNKSKYKMINEGVEKISKQPVVTQEDTFSQLVTAEVQISDRPVAHGNQNITWATWKRRKIAQLAIKNSSSPVSLNYRLSICIVIVFLLPVQLKCFWLKGTSVMAFQTGSQNA